MRLWLLAFLVACFVDTWAPAVYAQGVFEDCCLVYHRPVKTKVLLHAQKYWFQDVSGSCNLPAVIFYFPLKQKMVCGNPQDRWVQQGMQRLDSRNMAHQKHPQGIWRTSQGGSHSRGKKLSSGSSRLPLKFKHQARSNQRNASLLTTANTGG